MKLKAIKIEKSYKSRKVVNKVDLELSQGEIVGLLGPNGAGKTTCFYMIVGLIKSNGGKILIDTIDVSKGNTYPFPKTENRFFISIKCISRSAKEFAGTDKIRSFGNTGIDSNVMS